MAKKDSRPPYGETFELTERHVNERDVNHEPAAKRLLIVDDDQDVRESAELLMTTLGFTVTCADCGPSAVEFFQNNQQLFDWAIIDISMPGMDGIETIGRIRSTHPNLPIILATGYTDKNVPDEILRQPHTAMIRKPYRSAAVLQLLESIS